MKENGDIGLYYSPILELLMIGRISDYRLIGRVISNSNCLEDCYMMSSFMVGYSYKSWDKSDFYYMGTYRTFTTLEGYLNFLNDADYDSIKAYFKAKPHVQNLLSRSNRR